MKSFYHFYDEIHIQGISPVDRDAPLRSVIPADFNIWAPKNWPKEIVVWLARRKLKREFAVTNLRNPTS